MRTDSDLEKLLERLPPHIQEPLRKRKDLDQLLEIVLDLGRPSEARFRNETVCLSPREVADEDIRYVTDRVSAFGEDNRAGIERTLHRISAIRNRAGKVVGLTLRVGRAIHGTIKVIEDFVSSGKSVLLLGKPGVGKTTMLREVARVLSDDAKKRVVVVDTSNEIAGDGDIPHPGIGRARRMQVARPEKQHAVMIEAVENHMPESIIVDEIGNEQDAAAARTIAERGVQLVATAHGNTLENLIMNPTLADLVGGVQAVTLGDEEARRRRTQKTVLERRAPPTFDILVEIQNWNEVNVHPDVAAVVDEFLRGLPPSPEKRTLRPDGALERSRVPPRPEVVDRKRARPFQSEEPVHVEQFGPGPASPLIVDGAARVVRLMPIGVSKDRLRRAVRDFGLRIELTDRLDEAELILTTKSQRRRAAKIVSEAEQRGVPVHTLRKNTMAQIQLFLDEYSGGREPESEPEQSARNEAETAVARIEAGETQIHLAPQASHLRRLQHEIAEEAGFSSSSTGREPRRHVVIYR